MELGDFLAARGLRQQDLAAGMAVSEATVSRWVLGRHIPDGRRLAQIERLSGGAVTAANFVEAIAPLPVMLTGANATGEPRARRGRKSAFQMTALIPANEHLHAGLAETQALIAAIAAQAVKAAISAEKGRLRLEGNREAIKAHNRYVEEHGLPLAEYRMF